MIWTRIASDPASEASDAIVVSIRDRHVQRGWIGIHVQPVTADIANTLRLPSVSGSTVTRIDPDSPAAYAQLDPCDVILTVDGSDMPGSRALNRKIATLPSDTVTFHRHLARRNPTDGVGRGRNTSLG